MNEDTFNTIIDDYILPPILIDITDWSTEDLVNLSVKIDAELQKRADELDPPQEAELGDYAEYEEIEI